MARVRQYTKGLTYDEFIGDEKTMDAVLRNLEVIGEAATNTLLTPVFRTISCSPGYTLGVRL
ncbi:MAG: DUF86 domain-containing protein [candidate division WOR-3 bacterium]|nr:DUF86 domain-containing protein [candidate division WOR-3 bacterium]